MRTIKSILAILFLAVAFTACEEEYIVPEGELDAIENGEGGRPTGPSLPPPSQ